MRKLSILFVLVSILLMSCSLLGTSNQHLGGITFSDSDYNKNKAVTFVNNGGELSKALWMINGGEPYSEETGCRVLFYNNLKEKGFANELVPERFRAAGLEDAGFVIVASEADKEFYRDYAEDLKVYYATARVEMFSIKTGESLYIGDKIFGPQPPDQVQILKGTKELVWELPDSEAFEAQISAICRKLETGVLSGYSKGLRQDQEPGELCGIWEYSSNGVFENFAFTDDGYMVHEYLEYNKKKVEISTYFCENNTIVVNDGVQTYHYNLAGKYLVLREFSSDYRFKQLAKTVHNNADKEKLRGVWQTEDGSSVFCLLAFTRKGLAVWQGDYCGNSEYSQGKNTISSIEGESSFLVIDDNLYIFNGSFLGEPATVKLVRKTSEGKDSTTRNNLIDSGDLFYASTGFGESGNSFSFDTYGVFTDQKIIDGTKVSKTTGKYKYKDHIIEFSDGRKISFAIVDDFYIGYFCQ